jgi:hypothetical protein
VGLAAAFAGSRLIDSLVSGQTFAWTIAGLAAGVMATVVFGGVARTALRGVADPDLTTLVALAASYLAIAVVAMCVPVARMLRLLDPAAALRAE